MIMKKMHIQKLLDGIICKCLLDTFGLECQIKDECFFLNFILDDLSTAENEVLKVHNYYCSEVSIY